MPPCRYVEENGLTAMLTDKRPAGVAPEVTFMECVSCMPPPSMNKTAHSDFETKRACHHKSKTGVSVVPKNVLQLFF